MAYWFGGTGNFSDASHWSNNSGNSPASLLGHAPTASDDAIFDANSHNDDYTVTIDAVSTCKDFIMDKPTGVGKKVTWAGTSSLAISGNLTLTGGTAGITMTYNTTSGGLSFVATSGTKTIDFNGVPCSAASFTFNGSGAIFQLTRDLIFTVGSGFGIYLRVTAGTFDANGKNVTLNVSGNVPALEGFINTSSFYDLTIVGPNAKDRYIRTNTGFTVTHTLSINGNSTINRLLFYGATIGTPCTIDITGTTGNSFSNVDFRDINMVTGGADLDLSAITGLSGDCGGNSGIIFTDPADQHWTNADGGSWSTSTNWTSRTPLPQDDVYMDCAFNASKTVTQDMPRAGRSISWAGATGSPTWTTSTAASIFGSLDLTDLGTLTASTQTYTFEGRATGMPVGGWTLTMAGKTWAKPITITAVGGTYKLLDDLIQNDAINLIITFGAGTFNANGKNITTRGIATANAANTTKALIMGDGNTLTILGTGNLWNIGVNFTADMGTSTVKLTDASATATSLGWSGYSTPFYKVWITGALTKSLTIAGSNTFNELKDDGSEAHSLLFTAGTTQTGTTPGWFKVNGTSGKEITINSTTTRTYNLVNAGGGVVSCDYLDIQHCVATPLNSWYAGANSINNQSVATAGSGWIFSTPPSASTVVTNRGRNRFKFTPISQG